jgi:hypothetical protein
MRPFFAEFKFCVHTPVRDGTATAIKLPRAKRFEFPRLAGVNPFFSNSRGKFASFLEKSIAMNGKSLVAIVGSLALCSSLFVVAQIAAKDSPSADDKPRLFELRTYTTEPGKLDALQTRFRDHTTKLFEKHGMTNIGYWTPVEEPSSKDTLIYVLAHDSRAAADKSWQAFRSDPEWIKARTASEAPGPIVRKVESVFMNPTDFSGLK